MPTSVTFSRIIKYGLLNLWRYRLLSITAIVVMTISLLVVGFLLILNQLADLSAQNLQDRVEVSIFFGSDISVEKIEEVKEDFRKFEEVRSIEFVTAEAALQIFRERHKDDPLIQKTLEELQTNPLQSSLVISAKQLELYPVLIQKIERSRFQPIIKDINYEDSRKLIDTLDRITAGIRNFGALIAVIFGLVATLVIFNTLRLTIFSRREEIEIMKLVGASNWYVRGPYLVEGVLYGVFATLLSGLVLYPALFYSGPQITKFFGLDLSSGTYFSSDFWQLILTQALVGMFLGALSSVIVTKKHLRV